MAHERMLDKNAPPSDAEMCAVIGEPLAGAWTELRRFLLESYDLAPELQFGGPRYGWNLPYKKGGRPLAELYPEHGSFTVLVVLGKKELEQTLGRLDEFGETVRRFLVETPRFHDGCWMYMRIATGETSWQDVQDIEQLILIKKKPVKKQA